MGMVAPTVKTPQGLSASTFTTTSPSTANRMIMMDRMATKASAPRKGFNSSFTICPSERPLRRMEAVRMRKSCAAPPSTTPMRIHRVPGR